MNTNLHLILIEDFTRLTETDQFKYEKEKQIRKFKMILLKKGN